MTLSRQFLLQSVFWLGQCINSRNFQLMQWLLPGKGVGHLEVTVFLYVLLMQRMLCKAWPFLEVLIFIDRVLFVIDEGFQNCFNHNLVKEIVCSFRTNMIHLVLDFAYFYLISACYWFCHNLMRYKNFKVFTLNWLFVQGCQFVQMCCGRMRMRSCFCLIFFMMIYSI